MSAQQYFPPRSFGASVPDGVTLSYARQAKDPRDCAAYIETPHGPQQVLTGQWIATDSAGSRRVVSRSEYVALLATPPEPARHE